MLMWNVAGGLFKFRDVGSLCQDLWSTLSTDSGSTFTDDSYCRYAIYFNLDRRRRGNGSRRACAAPGLE